MHHGVELQEVVIAAFLGEARGSEPDDPIQVNLKRPFARPGDPVHEFALAPFAPVLPTSFGAHASFLFLAASASFL